MVEIPTAAQVTVAAATVRGLVGGLDVDAVPLSDVPDLWDAFDRVERLAAGAKVLLARKVDESKVWQRAGYNTAAVWMSRHGGTSVTAAQDILAASKRLTDLRDTAASVRAGDLSTVQTHAIAGAASVAPDAEPVLLALAGRASVGELRQECLRVKAKADPDPDKTYQRIWRNRRLRQGTDAEGAWTLHARGPVDAAAAFNAVLQPIVDEMFRKARGENRREPREAYAFDALVELTNRANNTDLDNDADDIDPDNRQADQAASRRADDHLMDPAGTDTPRDSDAGRAGGTKPDAASEPRTDAETDPKSLAPQVGDDHQGDHAGLVGPEPSAPTIGRRATAQPGYSSPSTPRVDPQAGELPSVGTSRSPNRAERRAGKRAKRKRRRLPNPKYLGLLRIDLTALVHGAVEGDELCEVAGLGPIPVSVARGLLGDTIWKLVITKGQPVAHVTHLGRHPTMAQHIALRWMSPHCTVLGCHRTDLERDHRVPWARTHHTTLDELDALCTHHHDLKTNRGWALINGTGKRPMVPPSHPAHPSNHTPPPDLSHDHDQASVPDPTSARHRLTTPGAKRTTVQPAA